MARKTIVAGNWKMNMTPSEAVKLCERSDLIWKRIQSIVTPISLCSKDSPQQRTGNWKMNMTPSEAVKLCEELKDLVKSDDVDVVYCVPAIDKKLKRCSAAGRDMTHLICKA